MPVIDVAPPYELVSSRHGPMLCNGNDFFMGKALVTYGECCEIELQTLLQLASFDGLVVEAGANMGIHTVPLGRFLAAQGRRLMAFEPQPVIFQQLCTNLALNGLPNVTAWPYACGAEAGTVAFAEPDYGRLGNFGAVSMDGPDSAAHAPCVRLDDMVDGARVGLLKIDVEGYELKVLKGSVATIGRSRPVIYVENDRVERSASLIEWLWGAGYQMWWHTPSLYNPKNFRGVTENLYPGVVSCNMLAVPTERAGDIVGARRVTDASYHPMRGAEDLTRRR